MLKLNLRDVPLLCGITLVVFLIIATVTFFDLDVAISALFYDENLGFYLKNNAVVNVFYRSVNVTIAAFLLFSLLFYVGIVFSTKLRKHSGLFTVLFLTLVLGPGLIVNTIFKDNYGRPRPAQTVEFGGDLPSRGFFDANWGGEGKSFPSGHASVPLGFLALSFALMRRKKVTLAKQTMVAFGVWYLAVSFARVSAGGHYFTDVIFAGYISFMTAWACCVAGEKLKRMKNKEKLMS